MMADGSLRSDLCELDAKPAQVRRSSPRAEPSRVEPSRAATARERGGLEDYFPVLDARRRIWELEQAEVQSAVRLLTETVALYKALGGGWREEGSTDPEIKAAGERSDIGVAVGSGR